MSVNVMRSVLLATMTFVAASTPESIADTTVENMNELNVALDAAAARGEKVSMGFLSYANYEGLKSVLPPEGEYFEVRLFDNLEHLEGNISDGTLYGGASAHFGEHPGLVAFGSGVMVARGAATLKGPAHAGIRAALDRAMVNAAMSGKLRALEEKYVDTYGSTLQWISSCSTQQSAYESTARNDTTTPFKLGGFQADWGYQGNYQVDPPTGFWPEFVTAMELPVERVWFESSAALMDALEAGEIDASEPYWTQPATHRGVARHLIFDYGCASVGTEDVVIVRSKAQTEGAAASKDEELSTGAIAAIAVLGGCAVLLVGFLLVVVKKERGGNPLFSPLVQAGEAA